MIRTIQKTDLPAMLEIVQRIYPENLTNADDLIGDVMDAWSNARIKPEYFVYEEDGAVLGFVGYAELAMTFDGYQAFWLMIDPSQQRTGIGTKLMHHVISEVKNKKGAYIIVHTYVPDFCKKFGFAQIDLLRDNPIMSLQV